MGDNARFDNLFLTIAEQCRESGGIENFVDSFFDFLGRRTDFYTGASKAEVEKMVKSKFNHHFEAALKRAEAAREERKAKEEEREYQRRKKAQEAAARVKEQEAASCVVPDDDDGSSRVQELTDEEAEKLQQELDAKKKVRGRVGKGSERKEVEPFLSFVASFGIVFKPRKLSRVRVRLSIRCAKWFSLFSCGFPSFVVPSFSKSLLVDNLTAKVGYLLGGTFLAVFFLFQDSA